MFRQDYGILYSMPHTDCWYDREPPDIVWMLTFQIFGGKSGGVISTRMGGTVPSGPGGR